MYVRATPLTYDAWREAAAKDLVERHGPRITVREKQWREAVHSANDADRSRHRAAADYEASRRPVDRAGSRKR